MVTKHKKHNTDESQEVSPLIVGDYKSASNRKDNITKIDMKHKEHKMVHKKKDRTGTVGKESLPVLNMFN